MNPRWLAMLLFFVFMALGFAAIGHMGMAAFSLFTAAAFSLIGSITS